MATDATLVETHDTPGHDTLVPDPQVQKEFGVTAMSIWRWDRDLELIKLGWPPPISFLPRRSLTRTVQQWSRDVTRQRARRQSFGWLCRRGGRRLQAGCLDGV